MKSTVFVLLLMMAAVSSQAQIQFGGGAHAGLAFSSFAEPTSELYGVGFGGGASADLTIMKYLALRLDVDYHSFPSDKEKLKNKFTVTDALGRPVDFSVAGANLSIIDVTLNAVGKLPTKSVVTPYGVIGMGMHFGSGSDFTLVSGGQTLLTQPVESKSNFGLNFGAGSEFRAGVSKLFIEAQYVLIFAEGGNAGFIPVTVGVVF